MLLTTLFALTLTGCDQAAEAPAPAAEDPCPEISMEGLAGDWIKVEGNKGDHSHRVRIVHDGASWSGVYVGGGFKKIPMAGELRAEDLMLTQVPEGLKKEQFESGADTISRLYFQPNKQTCSMRVVEVRVSMNEGKESEQQVGTGYQEYLPFPEGQVFTFRGCDETAFIGDAATSWTKAEKELAMEGGVNPVGVLGESVPVGAWSKAAEDGGADCSYDMDLYFDDRPAVKGQGGEPVGTLPAGEPAGEMRPWTWQWYAPYSGNHHFEIYRYRSCEGGERELIAVACLEAVLD